MRDESKAERLTRVGHTTVNTEDGKFSSRIGLHGVQDSLGLEASGFKSGTGDVYKEHVSCLLVFASELDERCLVV